MNIRNAVLHISEEYMTRDPAKVAEILSKPIDVVDCAMRALKRAGRLRVVAKPARKSKPHRFGKGEAHPNATLTEHDIRLILALVPELRAKYGNARRAIAEAAGKFELSPGHVIDIVAGRRWGHVR